MNPQMQAAMQIVMHTASEN